MEKKLSRIEEATLSRSTKKKTARVKKQFLSLKLDRITFLYTATDVILLS